MHDGKIRREFENLYDILHIAGYYRGLIYDARAVRDYLKEASEFIGKMKQKQTPINPLLIRKKPDGYN